MLYRLNIKEKPLRYSWHEFVMPLRYSLLLWGPHTHVVLVPCMHEFASMNMLVNEDTRVAHKVQPLRQIVNNFLRGTPVSHVIIELCLVMTGTST